MLSTIDELKVSPIGGNVAVVIVNYRTPELVERCLDALAAEREAIPSLRVWIVDNQSCDESVERIALAAGKHGADWVNFQALPLNGGFGWGNNQAIMRLMREESPPEFIYLLNPDAEIEPAAISALRDYLVAHPRCGVAGGQLVDRHGALSASAFAFPTPIGEFFEGARMSILARFFRAASPIVTSSAPRIVDWVSGASVMFRRRALQNVGLFDDGFFLYFEEVELIHRLKRAGWDCAFVPQSRVIHLGGAATGVDWDIGKRRPRYWYQSRRRLRIKLFGRFGTGLSFVLWLAGYTVWRTRALVSAAARRRGIAHELRDMVRANLAPVAFDLKSAAPRWDGEPGEPPAWMNRNPG